MATPAKKPRGLVRTKKIVPSEDDIKAKVEQLDALRTQKDHVEVQIKMVQDELLAALDAVGTKSIRVETETGRAIVATRVQASSTVINEGALKKRLGSVLWNKITTRVMDKKKLEAFIASGEIDAMVVANCSSNIDRAPYVKLS